MKKLIIFSLLIILGLLGIDFFRGSAQRMLPNQPVPQAVVQSVILEQNNSPLEPVTGGKRIFPDKDINNPMQNRKIVRVTATTSPIDVKESVIFKAFDVDDPTTDTIIDPNGNAGDDNRPNLTGGNAGTLSETDSDPGTSSEISTQVDENGVAIVYLTVTMQPGNNVVIAATVGFLDGVTVDGTGLKEGNTPLPTQKIKRTPLLTTWRKLHIEVDSMGNVAGNKEEGQITGAVKPTRNIMELTLDRVLEERRFQPGTVIVPNVGTFPVIDHFNSNGIDTITISTPLRTTNFIGVHYTLYDDDDFNNNTQSGGALGDIGENVIALSNTLSKIQTSDDPNQNIFAPAYVMPVIDGGGNPNFNNDDVTFALNVSDTVNSINQQIGQGIESRNNESDDFWVAYIQIAYQGDANRDFDPNFGLGPLDQDLAGQTTTDPLTNSVTNSSQVPVGGNGSLIYIETLRDYFTFRGRGENGLTVAHELGHQFGIQGHRGTDKVMQISTASVQAGDEKFVSDHINIIRWRVRSPGNR